MTATCRCAQVLAAFLAQFYANKPPPPLILVNELPAEADLLTEALGIKAERKVEILQPVRGARRNLIDNALANAREALARRLAENASQRHLLEGVQQALGLEQVPQRIEVYDNSHLQGRNPYGAMIVAGPEGFMKGAYRKFSIAGDVAPGDDYAMMREVLTRRFARVQKEDPDRERGQWPDLVLIDGGAGPAERRPGGPRRSRHRRCGALRHRQGPGPRRRARALLPARARALQPRAARSRALLPAAPARRGPSLRHRHPPGPALGRYRALAAGRDPGHRGQAQARPAAPFRLGRGRWRAAGLTDLESVAGISKAVAKKVYDHFHGQG